MNSNQKFKINKNSIFGINERVVKTNDKSFLFKAIKFLQGLLKRIAFYGVSRKSKLKE